MPVSNVVLLLIFFSCMMEMVCLLRCVHAVWNKWMQATVLSFSVKLLMLLSEICSLRFYRLTF